MAAHRRHDGKTESWEISIEGEIQELQSWRIQHMSDCHPDQHKELTEWQQGTSKRLDRLERLSAIVAGFTFGVGLVLGAIGRDWFLKWFS